MFGVIFEATFSGPGITEFAKVLPLVFFRGDANYLLSLLL